MARSTTRSEQLFAAAQRVLPGGVNSPVRNFAKVGGTPAFALRGQGALVWDADGFGGPEAKTGDYVQYSHEAGFEYGGFKLFYDLDTPLMSPQQVLGLYPPPAVVIYQ